MPSNPTDAQIAASVPVKTGRNEVAQGLAGNIFAAGILDPEHSDFLSKQFPQYTATSMLDRLGRSEGIGQSTWSWSEQDRTRQASQIQSGGAATGATIVLQTFTPAAVSGDGYALVNDILRTKHGLNLIVTAIGIDTLFQQITVRRQDGSNFVAGDTANNDYLGHSGNAFEEGSEAPGGRAYLPTQKDNSLNILRRTCEVTGSALTAKTYLNNGESWYYESEMIDMDEFARDRENAIMFNEKTTTVSGNPETGDGLVTMIGADGVNTNFGGSVSELDIQDHIKAMLKQSPAPEWTVFVGSDFLTDAQQALRDYSVGGGISYGVFGENTVGIDVHHYQFLGKKIHFVHYYPFDDVEVLPDPGTVTATDTNYSNYSLWMNMGEQRGKKLISMKHKELNGKQRKFIYKHNPGMMSDDGSGIAANGFDGMKSFMLSDIGVEARLMNNHGVLKANS